MSCTPDSRIELSLSPGDESRFVPHPSILGPATSASVLEKHFGARMTDVERKEPVLVEEEGGIVGATICFTPQSSPGVSPRVERRLERGGDAKNYIGELNVGSSNMRIASSLDNRSITEYELLDEIESRERSVEVEDLDLTEDVDDPVESATGNLARREHERENVTLGGSLGSIPDSLPSLTPFRRIEPLPQDPPETPRLTKESLFRNLEYSDEATAFSRMTKSMLSRMSKSGKLNVDNVEPDGDLSNASSSPKVDDTPMRTLTNLRAFWESRVLAKDAEDTEEVKNEELTENRSTQQELDASDSIGSNFQDSGMSSQAFSPRKTLSSFLLVIQVCVSLWVLRLAFRCALNLKKILENICDGLANNISSTTATRVDPLDDSTKNVNLDETDVDKVLGATRLKLSNLFSDDCVLDERNSCLDHSGEPVGPFEEIATNQAKPYTFGWKSVGATFIVVLAFVASLLLRFFAARSILFSDVSSQHVCLTTNTTSFDSVPLWEVNLSPPENIHLEIPVKSNFPRMAFLASLVIALLSAFVFHSDLYRLSVKTSSKHASGIWSPQEHEQFLEGYAQHGSKWKLVASFIPTRNYQQVKTHAHYWMKVGSPEVMKKSRKMTLDTTPKSMKSVVSDGGSTDVMGKRSRTMTLGSTPKPTRCVASTQTTPKLSNITTTLFDEVINKPESNSRNGLDTQTQSAKKRSQTKKSSSRYSL